MAEHSDLVSELNSVERMSTLDRLKHAKKRRTQQLKKFVQYEKQLEKEQHKKRKAGTASANAAASKQKKKARNVCFISDIMLLEAAARNDLDEVRKLLNDGVSPDAMNEDGLTALHQCCIDDLEAMMHLLIEFGANVNACDSELWTPLHAAATCGHVHLCKYLIDHKAELLAVNADGNMPYDICEDELTLDFIESEMSKRGVTQEMIDETRLSTETRMLNDMKLLSEKGESLEYRGRSGETPLHIAGANGYVHVAEYLLNQHVAVDPVDDDLWQPIHAAACWGQLPVLELLVEHGADLEAVTKAGETPLDICEDLDLKQRIIDMKDEIESHRATKKRDLVRKRSQNTRSSTASGNSMSSLYNSNTSLGEKAAVSASIRRTSMREKSQMHYKEAQEEAKMLRESADNLSPDTDEEETSDKISTSNGIDQNDNTKTPDDPPPAEVKDVVVNLPRDSLLVPKVVTPKTSPKTKKKDVAAHRKKGAESPGVTKKAAAGSSRDVDGKKPVETSSGDVKKPASSHSGDVKKPASSHSGDVKKPAPTHSGDASKPVSTHSDVKKPAVTSDKKDKASTKPQSMPSLDLPLSQLAGAASSPSKNSQQKPESNNTAPPAVHSNKTKPASSHSSPAGGAAPKSASSPGIGSGAPRGSTLADLKRQRAQKLHDSLRFRDTKLLNEQINSHNSMLVDGTTVGHNDEKTNGHNNGSLRNSINSNLSESAPEPQKHRFTARASEIIGDDVQNDNACCTIL